MARPHVEFIQSQNVAWAPASSRGLVRDARLKTFSADPEDGAFSALVDYASRSRALRPFTRAGSEELYVLWGELELNGRRLTRHHYAYLPPAYPRRSLSSSDGALVLTFFNGGHADAELAPPTDEDAGTSSAALIIDTEAMPWDGATLDPKLAHLRLSRKVLRAPADDPCRTYLLAGLPHGRPLDGLIQVEQHPHDEEMFLIEGDMACPQGVMRAGAYFYRPAGLVHGPHFSDHGFMMFMRNPGTRTIRTEWVGEARTLPRDPPFDPVLPPDAPAEWRRPHPSRPQY